MMSKVYDAIWQFDREEKSQITDVRGMGDVHTFIYEDASITINLPFVTLAPGLPDDNVYRVKVKWQDNDLYLFPPLGNKWELFAVWQDNRFVMYGEGKKKIFKKIKPEEIAPWQRDLLKPGREMWSYRYLNPDEVP